MNQANKADPTKERLLDEAEILFAGKGYHAVSVREITTAANCNLAAVNYHFGNKQNLYLEVFRFRWVPRAKRLHARLEESLTDHNPPSPAAVVKALAQAFLEGPLSEEEHTRHQLLIFRELSQPTEAFDIVLETAIRPLFEKLSSLLTAFVPEDTPKEDLILNISSVFGMILHFNSARPVITRMTGREYDAAFKTRLVEHIIEFSLRGLVHSEKETEQ